MIPRIFGRPVPAGSSDRRRDHRSPSLALEIFARLRADPRRHQDRHRRLGPPRRRGRRAVRESGLQGDVLLAPPGRIERHGRGPRSERERGLRRTGHRLRQRNPDRCPVRRASRARPRQRRRLKGKIVLDACTRSRPATAKWRMKRSRTASARLRRNILPARGWCAHSTRSARDRSRASRTAPESRSACRSRATTPEP